MDWLFWGKVVGGTVCAMAGALISLGMIVFMNGQGRYGRSARPDV